MKFNDLEFNTILNCFIFLDGAIYEFDERLAKLIIDDKVEFSIKEKEKCPTIKKIMKESDCLKK